MRLRRWWCQQHRIGRPHDRVLLVEQDVGAVGLRDVPDPDLAANIEALRQLLGDARDAVAVGPLGIAILRGIALRDLVVLVEGPDRQPDVAQRFLCPALSQQRLQLRRRRFDVLRAVVEDCAVQAPSGRASAHTATLLEDHDLDRGLAAAQLVGSGETGQSRADDRQLHDRFRGLG